MADTAHFLEKRSSAIAEAMVGEIANMVKVLVPTGSRPPFQKKVDLGWWRQNINGPLGQQALKYLNPVDIINLKQKIAGQEQAEKSTEVTTDAGYS